MTATPVPRLRWHQLPDHVRADLTDHIGARVIGEHLTGSLEPDPPHIPGLRAHQRAKGEAALAWLRTRLKG